METLFRSPLYTLDADRIAGVIEDLDRCEEWSEVVVIRSRFAAVAGFQGLEIHGVSMNDKESQLQFTARSGLDMDLGASGLSAGQRWHVLNFNTPIFVTPHALLMKDFEFAAPAGGSLTTLDRRMPSMLAMGLSLVDASRSRIVFVATRSVSSLKEDANDEHRQIRESASLSMFASHFADTLLRLVEEGRVDLPAMNLKSQEMRVLRWVAEGKTALETALILDVSESYVNQVFGVVMEKLGCTKAGQAISKACRLGLL